MALQVTYQGCIFAIQKMLMANLTTKTGTVETVSATSVIILLHLLNSDLRAKECVHISCVASSGRLDEGWP